MRVNEPITDHEIVVPDGEPIVSRTDRGGRIEFVNHVFTEISGFTEPELIGAPHNLVRHPHMPQQAFANLWATIKAGRPWDGLVKNRTKSGGYYWVRANVTPVLTNGEVTGYISIRSKPAREQIDRAEQAYAAIRAGTAKGIGLADGELVRAGPIAWLVEFGHSVLGRLLAVIVAALLAILLVLWLGLSGMSASNDALRNVYERGLVSVNQLRTILDSVRDSRNHIAQMTVALGRGAAAEQVLKEREAPVRAAMERIGLLWTSYSAGALTTEQRALAATFDTRYRTLVQDIIEPAFALARRGELAQLSALFERQGPPVFQAVFDADRALVENQIELGQAAYTEARDKFRWRLTVGGGLSLLSIAAVGVLGWMLLRTVRRCAGELETHFAAVIRGDLGTDIARPAAREFQRATSMLRAMRAHLAFATWEHREFERKAALIRRDTVEKMARTIEHETGSAVARVAERTGEMAKDADAMAASAERASATAEHVAEAADNAMKNAQIVAAASEELAAAINEVASQVEHASNVSRAAARKGVDAQTTIGSLSEAAEHIGTVVRLIADIAAKTNLLALNATIEAARAGEAGKGFAVVAGEVKALAAQTAKATEEISQHIGGLRGATDAAVSAVEDIGRTLEEVAQIAVTVATAVEEQTAATKEIARNVAESGVAVQEVTARIADVSAEAKETGQQAAELRTQSGRIAEDIAMLSGAVVHTIRTASTDADRRTEERVETKEPCSILPGGGGAPVRATIRNLSNGGAAIVPDNGSRLAEAHGTVVFDRRGGARVRFDVRAVDASGVLHVQFDRASITAEAERAIRSVLEAAAGRQEAPVQQRRA